MKASNRRMRPRQVASHPQRPRLSNLPQHVADCPFCKGNESRTPKATLEYVDKQTGDWTLRVVPNAFPAVSSPKPQVHTPAARSVSSAKAESPTSIASVMSTSVIHEIGNGLMYANEVDAVGYHEVVIESPIHNTYAWKHGGTMQMLRAWRDRGREMHAMDSSLQHVLYFKNNGGTAGASLLHPHSQIVGLPIVSFEAQERQENNLKFYQHHHKSVFDVMLDDELKLRQQCHTAHRIVASNTRFLSLVPFAASAPFTMWILPLASKCAHFEETSDNDITACANILDDALHRLHLKLNEPDYNLVLHTAPLRNASAQQAFHADAYFRWHIAITLRLGTCARCCDIAKLVCYINIFCLTPARHGW